MKQAATNYVRAICWLHDAHAECDGFAEEAEEIDVDILFDFWNTWATYREQLRRYRESRP